MSDMGICEQCDPQAGTTEEQLAPGIIQVRCGDCGCELYQEHFDPGDLFVEPDDPRCQ